MAEGDCIFCAIVAGDAPAEIVDEDEHTVSFMDIAPATRGHALVIPRRHSRDLHDISEEELAACASAAKRLAGRVPQRLGAQGVNVLNATGQAAWQSVFHFHLHVIPRYDDDPLKLPWVPAEGDRQEIQAAAADLRL